MLQWRVICSRVKERQEQSKDKKEELNKKLLEQFRNEALAALAS